MQPHQRERPVQALGDAGHLFKRLLAQVRHEARDLFGQAQLDTGQSRAQDRDLIRPARVVDPQVRQRRRSASESSRLRFEVKITAGRSRARIEPSSGIVI